jgi:hypothetical protein
MGAAWVARSSTTSGGRILLAKKSRSTVSCPILDLDVQRLDLAPSKFLGIPPKPGGECQIRLVSRQSCDGTRPLTRKRMEPADEEFLKATGKRSPVASR